MSLFTRVGNEDLEITPEVTTDLHETHMLEQEVNTALLNDFNANTTDLNDLETAQQAVVTLESLIEKDKLLLANADSITPADVVMSIENFRIVSDMIGYEGMTVATESMTEHNHQQLLQLSLEEKEEVKKGLVNKITDRIKVVGQRIKNTFSLVRTSFKNKHNMVAEVKTKLANSEKEPVAEINPATAKTLKMLLSSAGFLDIKTVDDTTVQTAIKELYHTLYPIENLKTLSSNLSVMINSKYDPKAAIKAPVPYTFTEKVVWDNLNDPSKNKDKWFGLSKKIDVDQILGFNALYRFDFTYITGDYTYTPVGLLLYRTGAKPTFFKGATKFKEFNSKVTKNIDEDKSIELLKLETLKKLLGMVETGLKDQSKVIGVMDEIYVKADAIGDLGVYVYLNNLAMVHMYSGNAVHNYLIHMINTVANHYKK